MRSFNVKKLDLVDTKRYIQGDVFLTEKEIGILHNGKIEPMVKQSELEKNYVKKKDIKRLIDAQLKKVNPDG